MGETLIKHLLTTIVDAFTVQINIVLPPEFRDVFGFVSANMAFDYEVTVENLAAEGAVFRDLWGGLDYHAIEDVVHVPQDHFQVTFKRLRDVELVCEAEDVADDILPPKKAVHVDKVIVREVAYAFPVAIDGNAGRAFV